MTRPGSFSSAGTTASGTVTIKHEPFKEWEVMNVSGIVHPVLARLARACVEPTFRRRPRGVALAYGVGVEVDVCGKHWEGSCYVPLGGDTAAALDLLVEKLGVYLDKVGIPA